MSKVRIAVLLMSAQRYLTMVINFVTVAVVSRLLRPEEIGVAVVGTLLGTMAIASREFATMNFLVQKPELTLEDKRAAFSVLALITGVTVVVLAVSAPWFAEAYKQPVLAPYLRVVALSIFLELFYLPIIALLQRNIAFGKVAIIMTSQVASGAIANIGLAATGFSSMSFAWAWLISAVCSTALALYLWRDKSIFVPIARGWRAMLTFGAYNGMNQFLYRVYESIPSLLLGRVTTMNAVGLYSRSMSICLLPDKIFLSGVMAVALPAFSERARNQKSLQEPYLRGISYITALQWPALIGITILAHPIVDIVLGSQWESAVPVIQIIALALLLSFTFEMNFPALMAIGAMRVVFLRAVVVWPVSTAILCTGAYFGLETMALAMWVAIPFQAYVGVRAVCKHIGITWREIFLALRKSIVVTAVTAAGPLSVVALSGFSLDLSVTQGIAAIVLAAPCWLFALWRTRHPLLQEILRILASFRQTHIGQRLAGWTAR